MKRLNEKICMNQFWININYYSLDNFEMESNWVENNSSWASANFYNFFVFLLYSSFTFRSLWFYTRRTLFSFYPFFISFSSPFSFYRHLSFSSLIFLYSFFNLFSFLTSILFSSFSFIRISSTFTTSSKSLWFLAQCSDVTSCWASKREFCNVSTLNFRY